MTEPTSGNILRVLIEPRVSDPGIWVAQCLETGFITTGAGYDEARESILEVLRTEIDYAQENGRSLAHSVVPAVLEQRWEIAIRDNPPETVQLFPPERKPPGRVAKIKNVTVAKSIG